MNSLPQAAIAAGSSRLDTIDALRGIAALAVVLHHAFIDYVRDSPLASLEPVFWLGSTGVWLFIVISGFCIHLRYARSAVQGRPETPNFVAFWKRRLWRLYPAYFAALLLYAGLRLLEGSIVLDRFFAYDLSLHLLLIHNLDPETVFGFCGVFWTLALEEHLYLAYFLLIRMRQRWGWGITLALCLAARAVGLVAHAAVKYVFQWESAFQALFVAQWFVWALGALSVEAYFGIVTLPRWCRSRAIALFLLGSIALAITIEREGQLPLLASRIWWAIRDPALGLGFFVLLNSLVLHQGRGTRGGPVVDLFAALGVFSYSLYLVHQAVQLHAIPGLLGAMGATPSLWMAPLVVMLSILFARTFFNLFERPFLTSAGKAAS